MKKTILAMLTMAIVISAVMLSCDPTPDNNGNNNGKPHQTTITAFGKEATVIGDAALSTADFNTAKGKL